MNLFPEQKKNLINMFQAHGNLFQTAVKTAQDDVPSLQNSIKSSLNDQ